MQHFDVLIIGAGLSGIGMACQLSQKCPNKRFAVLERRRAIGGTWDLFRYPGIRSDSDMFTFGFDFRPWHETKVLADGASIRNYIQATAREYDIEKHVQYGMKVTDANWNSTAKHWVVTATHEADGKIETYTAQHMVMATGYYNYDQGFLPEFAGKDDFKGICVHPQKWPENLDYANKKVVVIGSGATAVTLVPSMASTAQKVTMLQRSPTYIISVPSRDKFSESLQKILPKNMVFKLARKRNLFLQKFLYDNANKHPAMIKKFLLKRVEAQIGKHSDMKHFTPKYNPWEERLCAVPSGDLFKAIRSGKADVVTDHIDKFIENGILLKSGQKLEADIIVTATGLNLQILGDMTVRLDDKPVNLSSGMTYKAVLGENLPNFAWLFGYINASWTLKVNIAADYLCRLYNHLDKIGKRVAIPQATPEEHTDHSIMDALGAGYVQRKRDFIPRQGKKLPWRVLNDFGKDTTMLTKSPLDDGILQFS